MSNTESVALVTTTSQVGSPRQIPALQGTVLDGPLQKPAVITVRASMSTAIGGSAQPTERSYAAAAEAAADAPTLLGEQARLACEAYSSAARLQVRGTA